MMSEHYPECRILPPINETFPQFSRPHISLLSPLDLSLRASNAVPITPPSTPSPPRKRQRLMSDENYLWRPHVMATSTATGDATATATTDTASATSAASEGMAGGVCGGNYFSHLNYDYRPEMPATAARYKNNLHDIVGYFEEIPQMQRSAKRSTAPQQSAKSATIATATTVSGGSNSSGSCEDLPTIYVDDETIVLTEDEDETLVSSHDCTDDDEAPDGSEGHQAMRSSGGHDSFDMNDMLEVAVESKEDEEEFVDVLSNDDDDAVNARLRLQTQALEAELEDGGKVLTRNKLVYDNEELHHQAIDGLAKLFECDFRPRSVALSLPQSQESPTETGANHIVMTTANKTYIDLSSGENRVVHDAASTKAAGQQGSPAMGAVEAKGRSHHPKSQKSERKRLKLRKNACIDEETNSPVSGTIIRKLRDDEELVVRKGDIDPAFNVVEVTEEAKAILASIDNKIGAYLCQLCRTLYDDAFLLAQHRCPRIMHIEYKCSECEKVFNCPANLASHRRWHKPKSELLASSQQKKRAHMLNTSIGLGDLGDKSPTDEGADGIYPCPQCGKNFRRHAYLKKHQASHQMMDNLKGLDIFKNPHGLGASPPHPGQSVFSMNLPPGVHHPHLPHHLHQRAPPHAAPYPQTAPALKPPYPQRFGTFPALMPPFDQRRFYSLGEFYLSQHLDRSSAFQYVQANHLRNLSTVASNFMQRPPLMPAGMVPSMVPSLMSMPVK